MGWGWGRRGERGKIRRCCDLSRKEGVGRGECSGAKNLRSLITAVEATFPSAGPMHTCSLDQLSTERRDAVGLWSATTHPIRSHWLCVAVERWKRAPAN